jgi:chromosomal replication initiation ATPase DnaA
MSQLTLSISLPAVFSEDNFHVADCNREAHQWAARWPDWPGNALLLYGPSGAGKSHLGQLWAARAKAQRFSTRETSLLSPDTMRGNWLVEDIENVSDARALLHLINFSGENKTSLLLTANAPPKRLPFTLPDLTSRLLALTAIGISSPDEATIAAVLRKQFADRQLKVEDEIIAYLLPRMERTYAGAAIIVDTLDTEALAEQRNLTVPFVKRVLGY